jgi:peptide/nickel transport system substrate-binding protein
MLLLGLASAATRPRYGGTLHVSFRAAPASLNPIELAGTPDGRNLIQIMFDTLVRLDDRGNPQPGLAVSWQAAPGDQRWQFRLRPGVTFHDGSPLTADAAAASLRAANPGWRVFAAGDAVIIERDSPAPELPAELALGRNAIARRSGGQVVGTGPFSISRWIAGKQLTLAAYNECWEGRPFLDSVQADLGMGFREQSLALDLKKTDVIEIPAEQARRAGTQGLRMEASAPDELMALVFAGVAKSEDETRLRQALALSLDRVALNRVLLQGAGEPAGALLPEWMSGYSFLFPVNADVAKALEARGQARQSAPWTLAYDAGDPLARLVAERVALNARDAGIQVQVITSGTPDMRLLRVPIPSLDAPLSLAMVQAALGLTPAKMSGKSPEELFAAESAVLQSGRVIPLLHLRSGFAMTLSVRNWSMSPEGGWRPAELWLGAERP